MKRALRRVFRFLRDVVPPTGRGYLLLALSSLVLWFYGIESLDLVLFVTGIAGLVLVCLSTLVVGVCGLVLWRRLRPAASRPLRLESGHPQRTGFDAPALTLLPLVSVTWDWLEPHGVEVRTLPVRGRMVEEVKPARRCQVHEVVRRFVVRDVFGLARVAWVTRETGPITVYPNVGRLKNMPVVQSMSAGENIPLPHGKPEGDRIDIRGYVPGDSVRNIMWKLYARTRQLNVRVPERAVAQTKKTVAYLTAGERDEPAAAAARVALETGALGPGWLFGADGAGDPTDDPERALLAVARSGGAGDGTRPPHTIGAFLEKVMTHPHSGAGGQAHCIVFAPARSGDWLKPALEAARRHPGALSFVLGTDGVVRAHALPLWRRVLLAEDAPEGVPSDELSRVLRQIGAAGCTALVVDRVSGRTFSQQQQLLLGA